MKKLFIMQLLLLSSLLFIASTYGGIETTKHDLSTDSSDSDVGSLTSEQICIFCHIPHNASPSGPLWNRPDPGSVYTLYSSKTLDAETMDPREVPGGTSILCLSCHDGTIALGDLLSEDTPIPMSQEFVQDRVNLGTDLSDDHPISFYYDPNLAERDEKLVSPDLLTEEVRLRNGYMECTSCHDPHDDTYGKFLVKDAVNGELCETCHTIFHGDTPHKNSLAAISVNDEDPLDNFDWGTVQEFACFNCHTPHAAAKSERLLKHANEEDNCLICHNGTVATTDLESVFDKSYKHDLSDVDLHDPSEFDLDDVTVTDEHVECQDCHNAHAVLSYAENNLSGALNQVVGIDINGDKIDPILEDYQLCFRCHGETQPISNTTRLVDEIGNEGNVLSDFQTDNPSFHPVAGQADNSVYQSTGLPSLITMDLNVLSIIKCTDCHNNNDTSGPRGPHGSDFEHILERQYMTVDGTEELEENYALCYKCHNRDSILADESFLRHNRHITGSGGGQGDGGGQATPCNVCHDPHGVLSDGGIGGTHSGTKLINFDLDVVTENKSGLLYYESTAAFEGTCYLKCHGKEHDPCSYTSTSSSCGPGGGGGGGVGVGQ